MRLGEFLILMLHLLKCNRKVLVNYQIIRENINAFKQFWQILGQFITDIFYVSFKLKSNYT